MTFSADEAASCRRLVELALAEDLDGAGDVTSQAVIPAEQVGQGLFVARSQGVVGGLPAAAMVVSMVDPTLVFESLVEDGAAVQHGMHLAKISGRMRGILAVERTALNFLQRLSGVATLTAKFVAAAKGLPAKILDTRKTTPGWRLVEKYAVRCGGGHNHRIGLYDGILIKDNHLRGLQIADCRLQLEEAVRRARSRSDLPVEIEVESLEQLRFVLPLRPEIVLLDNMTTTQMREAVRLRDKAAAGVQLEASGGVTLETVRGIAETGVDRISVGALTHSAVALDIALDYLPS